MTAKDAGLWGMGGAVAGLGALGILGYLASKERWKGKMPALPKNASEALTALFDSREAPTGTNDERLLAYVVHDLDRAMERESELRECVIAAASDIVRLEADKADLQKEVAKLTERLNGLDGELGRKSQTIVELQGLVGNLRAEQVRPPGPAARRRRRKP